MLRLAQAATAGTGVSDQEDTMYLVTYLVSLPVNIERMYESRGQLIRRFPRRSETLHNSDRKVSSYIVVGF